MSSSLSSSLKIILFFCVFVIKLFYLLGIGGQNRVGRELGWSRFATEWKCSRDIIECSPKSLWHQRIDNWMDNWVKVVKKTWRYSWKLIEFRSWSHLTIWRERSEHASAWCSSFPGEWSTWTTICWRGMESSRQRMQRQPPPTSWSQPFYLDCTV